MLTSSSFCYFVVFIGMYLLSHCDNVFSSFLSRCRRHNALQFPFLNSRGSHETRMKPPLLIVTRYFPNQPASQQTPGTKLNTHTRTAELKIIKWWRRRSGRQQHREKQRRRPSEREREEEATTVAAHVRRGDVKGNQ